MCTVNMKGFNHYKNRCGYILIQNQHGKPLLHWEEFPKPVFTKMCELYVSDVEADVM